MTEPLKLEITFRDAVLNTKDNKPTLDKLIESAETIVIEHFRDAYFKANARKPFAYPEGGLDAHLIQLAKKALDDHRGINGGIADPYDDIQKIYGKITSMARVSLIKDFGPTIADHVHPTIKFI